MRVAMILTVFTCAACGEDGPAIDAAVCVVAECASSRAVWTGDEVIIWGGCYANDESNWFALYRPPDPP